MNTELRELTTDGTSGFSNRFLADIDSVEPEGRILPFPAESRAASHPLIAQILKPESPRTIQEMLTRFQDAVPGAVLEVTISIKVAMPRNNPQINGRDIFGGEEIVLAPTLPLNQGDVTLYDNVSVRPVVDFPNPNVREDQFGLETHGYFGTPLNFMYTSLDQEIQRGLETTTYTDDEDTGMQYYGSYDEAVEIFDAKELAAHEGVNAGSRMTESEESDDRGFVPFGGYDRVARAVTVILARENDSPLTDREYEVLQLIADGLSNSEIAARLYIGRRTVDAHLANIYKKLRVNGRTSAVEHALQAEYISVSQSAHSVVSDATSGLSVREREIGRILNLTNKEIAKDLGIRLRTVDTHVQRILNKLGVENRTQACLLISSAFPQT